MTKAEQFRSIKKYYQDLNKIIDNTKSEKKSITGKKSFGLHDNVPFLITSLMFSFAGVGALLTLVTKLPAFIACPVAIVSSIGFSLGLPNLIHHLILKANSKKSRGYAKLEIDSLFNVMKEIYSKNYKRIINAESAEELSQEEIDSFVKQAGIYAENYKYFLGKYVGERIFKKNQDDYKKIKNLYSNMNSTNKYQTLSKIEKIVLKNNQYNKPWCELYNSCGRISKKLYNITKPVCESLQIPADKKFEADYKYINKKIEKELNIKINGLQSENESLNLDIESDEFVLNKSISSIRNELQSKKEQVEEL